MPESAIDGAGSLVMQGDIKTTALPFDKLIHYNKEMVKNEASDTALSWDLLFGHSKSRLKQTRDPEHYPAFSKNIIKSIQDALKQSKLKAKEDVQALLELYPQPNAVRLIEWTVSMLERHKIIQQSISKYIGTIGRDWPC